MSDTFNPAELKLWAYWEGEMSPTIKMCVETIQRHHPDRFVLLNPDSFAELQKHHQDANPALQDLAKIQKRADWIRLYLLHYFGGGWIDCDHLCLRPLDPLFDQLKRYQFIGYRCKNVTQNGIMFARPGSQFVADAFAAASSKLAQGNTKAWMALGSNIIEPMTRKPKKYPNLKIFWRHKFCAYPISDRRSLMREGSDQRHEAACQKHAYTMHLGYPRVALFDDLSAKERKSGRTMLSYLFRKAMGKGVELPMGSYLPGKPTKRLRHAEAVIRRLDAREELRGAELGVLGGNFSRALLRRLPQLHLSMIDIWEAQEPSGSYRTSGDALAKRETPFFQNRKALAARRTEFARDRRVLIQSDTSAAAADFDDGSLDFVFVDADHSKEGVQKDLDAWWRKVKKGGMLCGHDYDFPTFPGVREAVTEFAKKKRKKVEVDEGWTWFIQK